MFRIYQPPAFLQRALPQRRWRVPAVPDALYLTFDDGPIPEVTPWVLEQLAVFDARATFFCVGQNLMRHPDVAQAVLAGGHRLANHTQHHLRGTQTPLDTYLADVAACQTLLDALQPDVARLLRPPYGRATLAQVRALQQASYGLVMWDVLTYDFDSSLSAAECLRQAVRHTRPGSIIVFHDSLKAERNLRAVLPQYLAHFHQNGFRFLALTD